MGYYPLKDKVVKARKQHRCEWCDESILVGETAHYRVYVWEDEFYHAYMHEDCRKAMNSAPLDLVEEGWTPGEFKRGSIDEH